MRSASRQKSCVLFSELWTHEPALPGGRRARQGYITRAYQYDGALAYAIRFRLQNGRSATRRYEAKSLAPQVAAARAGGAALRFQARADPAADPDEAVDESRFVQYLHS